MHAQDPASEQRLCRSRTVLPRCTASVSSVTELPVRDARTDTQNIAATDDSPRPSDGSGAGPTRRAHFTFRGELAVSVQILLAANTPGTTGRRVRAGRGHSYSAPSCWVVARP